jgi:hypothetical protein
VLQNEPGFIDSHDVVVRVNNFKLTPQTGRRTDVFYSFFGSSIRKTPYELKSGGVVLCMAKCPNALCIDSPWHVRRGKMLGIDFRLIYARRAAWWFCPTYIPSVEEFMALFEMMKKHVPTTGFSAILDVLSFAPKSIHLTGFDFFASGIHNVNERWRPGHPSDPIRHMPELEAAWVRKQVRIGNLPLTLDKALAARLRG